MKLFFFVCKNQKRKKLNMFCNVVNNLINCSNIFRQKDYLKKCAIYRWFIKGLVWTRCIMHPVDPPTRSFAFPTPIHFHLLRPLEPHPHPLPLHEKNKNHDPPKLFAQKKCIQISSLTFQIPKIHPPSTTTIVARKWT
jgi:hypothetical protein